MKNESSPRCGTLHNAKVIENETVNNTIRRILENGQTPDGGVHVLAAIASDKSPNPDGPAHCIFAIQVGSRGLELEENIEDRLCRATEDLRQEFRSGEIVEQGLVDVPDDLDPKGRKVTLLYTALTHSGETSVQLTGALMDLACDDSERGTAFRDMMSLPGLLAKIDRELEQMGQAVSEGECLRQATDLMTEGNPSPDMKGLTDSLLRRLDTLKSVFEGMKEIRLGIKTEGVTIGNMRTLRELVQRCANILEEDDKPGDEDVEAQINIEIKGVETNPEGLIALLMKLMSRQHKNRERLDELQKLARVAVEKANSWDAMAEVINDSDPGVFEAMADDCDIILDWVKESVRVREHFIKTVANPDEANNAETLNKTSAGE